MAQEDKLKREIDQLAKLLGKLIADLTGLKNTEQSDEVLTNTQQTLSDTVGIDLNPLLDKPSKFFLNELDKLQLSNHHLEQLADLFYLLGERTNKSDKSLNFYTKALVLYEKIASVSSSYSLEQHYRIEKIKKLLS